MAKRNAGTGMARSEKISGGFFLLAYFAVLPPVSGTLFDFLQKTFSIAISGNIRNTAYYCILSALAAIALGGYFVREARAFFDHVWSGLGAAALGLIAFYGLNELSWRVLRLVPGEWVNLNDQALLDRLAADPYGTVLVLVILSPVIEETVFRGYIFGNLREYHRGAAYAFSCALFALAHVWPYAAGAPNWRQLVFLAQYLLPGAVMAWTFERSGSLWGSVLLHGAVNGLAVWRAM